MTILAELLHVTPQGLRLSTLIRTDKEFSQFIYLGKEKPPIAHTQAETLDELQENLKEVLELCLEVMV